MTKEEIEISFNRAKDSGASHMLLVTDREDNFTTRPALAFGDEDLEKVMRFYDNVSDEVVEVYDLDIPLEQQINSDIPVFNL
jgi:hypothetical protein